MEVVGTPSVYMIYNSKVNPRWSAVDPGGVIPIVDRTIDSLIRTQGIGDMFRIYLGSVRDRLDFHLSYIPDDFSVEPGEQFDPVHMRALFNRAYRTAESGSPSGGIRSDSSSVEMRCRISLLPVSPGTMARAPESSSAEA